MTDDKEAPAGQGGGEQASENTSNSTNKDSAGPSEEQGSRKPFMTSPEPWDGPVDGAELLDQLVELFRRHLSLPEFTAEALALWVLLTHGLDAFEASPRLAILSPVHECGKTTVLKLLARLVPVPLPASNLTSAIIYRVIESKQPTLLIDEADTYFDHNHEIAGILNSGHSRDAAFVWRCGTADDNFEVRHFSTWTPIAIAKIGDLPPTLASRSIIIHMRRARSDEAIQRLRPQHYDEIEDLARKTAAWIKSKFDQLRNADPNMPDDLDNRAADNWRPLLAIADQAGGHWPETARRAAIHLLSDPEPPPWVHLLAAIRKVFDEKGTDRVFSADLCDQLKKLDEGLSWTPTALARLLEPFGIRPKTIRKDARTPTKRGYMRADFEDTFARYLRPESSDTAH